MAQASSWGRLRSITSQVSQDILWVPNPRSHYEIWRKGTRLEKDLSLYARIALAQEINGGESTLVQIIQMRFSQQVIKAFGERNPSWAKRHLGTMQCDLSNPDGVWIFSFDWQKWRLKVWENQGADWVSIPMQQATLIEQDNPITGLGFGCSERNS